MADTVYTPINTLKQVDENIWIVDGGVIHFYAIPFTTRMTIVKLGNGDLFCHSPIKLTPSLASEVKRLGQVKHLVSPNWIHYAYIAEWVEAFPNTTTWASPGVKERAAKFKVDINFNSDLENEPPADWRDEIDQLIVEGSSIHREVVFFHKSSRTLILTDLIENFEREKIPAWLRPLAYVAGIMDPDGKTPLDIRYLLSKDKKALRTSVNQMIGWKPEKVILAHGRWYEKNGTQELKRAFRWV